MQRILPKLSAVILASLLIAPVAIHAQDEKEKDKSDKKMSIKLSSQEKRMTKEKLLSRSMVIK